MSVRILRQGNIEDDSYHICAPRDSGFTTICGFADTVLYEVSDEPVTCELCMALKQEEA